MFNYEIPIHEDSFVYLFAFALHTIIKHRNHTQQKLFLAKNFSATSFLLQNCDSDSFCAFQYSTIGKFICVLYE